MGYYTTGITILDPIRIDEGRGGILFRWQDDYTDKLYQLYINGELAAETAEIGAPKELTAGQATGKYTFEIIAVDPADAGTDYSEYLEYGDAIGSKVELKWPRASTLDKRGYHNIFWDAGTGTVDETEEINAEKMENFPAGQPRRGQGAGPHGRGPHGREGRSIGFGRHAHGAGPHGFDQTMMKFVTDKLPPGFYKFRIRPYDRAGNAGGDTDETIVVDCPPVSPEAIEAAGYVKASNTLTLTLTAGVERLPY